MIYIKGDYSESQNITDGNGYHDKIFVDTSFIYETSPMFVTDQPNFLNAACKVATNLKPEKLLVNQVLEELQRQDMDRDRLIWI